MLWMQGATQRVSFSLIQSSGWDVTDPQSLERILYVWAIRHPASGYVQGINDLATPFFQVFLSSYIGTSASVTDILLYLLNFSVRL